MINLSLGRLVYDWAALDPLCQAVEAAWKSGIFVAVAAGNQGRNNTMDTNGYGTITAPGNEPYVMTVGSMNAHLTTSRGDDTVASYSSKGPTLYDHYAKPDILAPGNMVVSTLPAGLTLSNLHPANRVGNTNYFTLSGISMATPVVAAWAAMGYQWNTTITNDNIKADFMMSASKTFPGSSTVVDPTTGQSYTS